MENNTNTIYHERRRAMAMIALGRNRISSVEYRRIFDLPPIFHIVAPKRVVHEYPEPDFEVGRQWLREYTDLGDKVDDMDNGEVYKAIDKSIDDTPAFDAAEQRKLHPAMALGQNRILSSIALLILTALAIFGAAKLMELMF